MNADKPKLTMTFTPNTIEHLGIRMYSTLPPVLAELVANSYDADASQVTVKLYDKGNKRIIVEDDGHGMTFDEIDTKFLRIGRNRRAGEAEQSPNGRYVIGKKGLGKLSFLGIASKVEIKTVKNGLVNVFLLDKNKIIRNDRSEEKLYQQADYHPNIIKSDESTREPHSTVITLSELDRETDFNPEAIADSLAKLFIIDKEFSIRVSHNDKQPIELDNDRRFASLKEIQFEWLIPEDMGRSIDYFKEKKIHGKIISTVQPISAKTNMRGIMLFSRGKLVNLPEFFADSTSSNFYSYATGWLEVDFIDNIKPDVIGTNRQSLDWRHPETIELREKLQEFVRWLYLNWRAKRAEATNKKIKEITGINVTDWQSKVPADMNKPLSAVISVLRSTSVDVPEKEEELTKGLSQLKELVPEYPLFHYRHMNPTLNSTVFKVYKAKDYYKAVHMGATRYIDEVRLKSKAEAKNELKLLEHVFGPASPKLSVIQGFKCLNGQDFKDTTLVTIAEGHKLLTIAMWRAFRNPIAHELPENLRESGLYTEQDCLDALSLLSHLFDRLEKSTIIQN